MITAKYAGEQQYNNTKGVLFTLTFSGFYGVAGVGDLLNLEPYDVEANPGGVQDPLHAYNSILTQPPVILPAPISQNLAGAYVQITPNAVPTLTNFGVRCFAPGGAELNSNQAYAGTGFAAGSVLLLVFIPALQ